MKRLVPIFVFCLASAISSGRQRGLMHCFTFTEIPEATAAD